MKWILIFLLIPFVSNGQYASFTQDKLFYFSASASLDEVKSIYDTTVLNKGDEKCNHRFVAKQSPFTGAVCAVFHGAAGCPDTWYNNYEMCSLCLRHIHVKETRVAVAREDEYSKLLERLNKNK